MSIRVAIQAMPENPYEPERRSLAFGQDYIHGYREWISSIGLSMRMVPYRKNREGRLVNIDHSEIRRDVSRERKTISDYLTSQSPEYVRDLQEAASSFPSMSPACRIAIQIPTHLEERNMYHMLTHWAAQLSLQQEPLDSSLYEINIINNGPEGYQKDQTLSEVERFKKAFPDVRVYSIDIEFPTKTGNVGMARKLLTDLILQRSLHRTSQQGPLYIESGDADIFHIEQDTLAKRIQQFDTKPYLDALAGPRDFCPDILTHNDYLFLSIRARSFVINLLRAYQWRPDKNEDFSSYNGVMMGGLSTAFTAEAYALAGGYLAALAREDFDLGKRIEIVRGMSDDQGRFIPNTYTIEPTSTRMQSSPRRFIYAIATGTHPYMDFSNRHMTTEMRELDPYKMVLCLPNARISAENIKVFERMLTRQRAFLASSVKNIETREHIFHRMMFLLGFGRYTMLEDGEKKSSKMVQEDTKGWTPDYHIVEGDAVKIENIENIRYTLDRYREKHGGSS